jgi:hypothetical protein
MKAKAWRKAETQSDENRFVLKTDQRKDFNQNSLPIRHNDLGIVFGADETERTCIANAARYWN